VKQVLVGLVAVAVVALFEGLVQTFRFFGEKRNDELKRRLQNLGTPDSAGLTLLRQGKLAANNFVDSLLRGVPLAERLELLIEQAQLDFTVARLMGYSVGLAVLMAGVAILVYGLALAPVLGFLGLLTPTFIVWSVREQRSVKLSEQLPDALEMMARSLRAGHALAASFKLVAGEMPSPVNIEFGRAFEEQNLGIPFERAVVQMTQRAPTNRDLKIFAVSVIIQKETGGNLVEIIEKIAETIRLRYRFYGKLRALTAEGRMSAIVIGVLPFVAGVAVALVNREYMSGLIEKPLGRMFLIYAVVSWVVGIVWLRRMARVDY
jgi:tight adherence protein B